MMKKLFNLLFVFCCFMQLNAQNDLTDIKPFYGTNEDGIVRCASDEIHANRMLNDAQYAIEYNKTQQVVSEYMENLTVEQMKAPCASPTVIPVAVHYETGAGTLNAGSTQCMVDAALSQIAQLNLDFSSCNNNISNFCDWTESCENQLNGNVTGSPMPEDGACIVFCLGDTNLPAGEDNIGGYAITFGDYSDNAQSTGGTWAGYLNIFVGDAGGFLGFAPLSGGANPNGFDGVTILDSAFGSVTAGVGFTGCQGIGTGAPYNGGATTTHEIGHYFGLEHTFENPAENDIPNQNNPNYGTVTYNTGTCTATGCQGGCDGYQGNFMDYVDDNSMFMFTEQQVNNMLATIAGANYTASSCSNATAVADAYEACYVPQADGTGCEEKAVCNHTINVTTACDGASYTATVTITAGTGPFTVTSSAGGTVAGAGTSFTVSGLTADSTISVEDTGEANCIQTASVTSPCCAAIGFTAPANVCSGDLLTVTAPATCGFTGTAGTSPLDAGATGTYPIILIDQTTTATPNLTTIDFSALDVNGFLTNNATSDGALVFAEPCGNFEFTPNNTSCDPVYLHFIVTEFTGEVATGAFTTGCQSAVVTVEVLPQPDAPALTINNCQVTLTANCPDDVISVTGGNGSGTSGATATYNYDTAQAIDIDVTNTSCATAFTYTTPAVPTPTLTCPGTASCSTDAALSADLLPGELALGTVTISITPDFFTSEMGIDVTDATGTLIFQIAPGDFADGDFAPYGPTAVPFAITVPDVILSSSLQPVGTYTIGGTADPITVTFTDTFGDGWDDTGAGGSVVGSYSINDYTGATLVGNTGFTTASQTETVNATIEQVISTTGVWSGTGITDNNDGTATFNSASNGTFTATYTYTDDLGCQGIATCDITVSDCTALEHCADICFAEYDAAPTGGSVPNATLCVTPLGCADNPDATCLQTTACNDNDSCTNGEQETTVIATGEVCTTCGGGAPVTPACGDATATNYDAAATCIDNTLCIFEYCADVCYVEYNANPGANDIANAALCVTPLGCADNPDATCLQTTACNDNDSCTNGEQETTVILTGEVCTTCGGGTAVTPACGDATATNYDATATCIDNSLCTYGEYCDNICYAEYTATPGANDTPNATLCITPLGCADNPDASCTSLQACDDGDDCTTGEQATVITASGEVCNDCGLNATAVSPACGDATATNYDATATCIDNSLCTYGEYCDNICYAEYTATPGANDTPNATLCITPLGCADNPDATCLQTTACNDNDSCTNGEQETTVILTGEVCTTCGGGAPVPPACGDPAANNFDAAATCIDNTLCTYDNPTLNPNLQDSDPCSCGDPLNNDTDEDENGILVDTNADGVTGLFHEVVTIQANSFNSITGVTLVSETGMLDFLGNPVPALPAINTAGTNGVVVTVTGAAPTFTITIEFYHTASVGYSNTQFAIAGTDTADGAITLNSSVFENTCEPCPFSADIPTLSEWGLITLALMLMTYGSIAMAGLGSLAGTNNVSTPIGLQLPVNAAILRKAFVLTAVLALLGYTMSIVFFGAIFFSDIIGVAIAGSVFAYLIHILYLIEQNK